MQRKDKLMLEVRRHHKEWYDYMLKKNGITEAMLEAHRRKQYRAQGIETEEEALSIDFSQLHLLMSRSRKRIKMTAPNSSQSRNPRWRRMVLDGLHGKARSGGMVDRRISGSLGGWKSYPN